MSDFEHLGLAELAQGFREQSLDPVTLAEWCGERHAGYGRRLGAYKTWGGQQACTVAGLAADAFRRQLDLGPLQGIPVSVKDLYGVPGFPTFAGSPRPLPPEWERAGPLVSVVRRQLAPVTGKTHTVEFAYGGLGTNPHWGAPFNPWSVSKRRVPGGSSAGAGVSLVEGSALLALGTDTAGSVRIPASMTGTVGLKTTVGRWPTEGIVPLSTSFDTPGLLARTVADAVWAFRAMEEGLNGVNPEIPTLTAGELRIGVPDHFFWVDCSPGVVEAVRQPLQELQQAGARLRTLELPGLEETYGYFRLGGLASPELYRFLSQELPDWLETLDGNVHQRMEAAKLSPAWEYLQRRQRFQVIGRHAAQRLASVDVLAVPTVAVTPPTLAELDVEGAYARNNLLALRNTSVANVLGLCAITLPAGLDAAGMPAGLMLMSGPGREEHLLAAAVAVERCIGTGLQRLGRAPALQESTTA